MRFSIHSFQFVAIVTLTCLTLTAAWAKDDKNVLPDDAEFIAFVSDGCEDCSVLSKKKACYEYLNTCSYLAKVYDPALDATIEVVLDEKKNKLLLDSKALKKLEKQQKYLEKGPVHDDLDAALAGLAQDDTVPLVIWLKTWEAPYDREDLIADPGFMDDVTAAHTQAVVNVQQGFAEALAPEGLVPQFYPEAPAVYVEATPAQALWLTSLEAVASMYLWEPGTPLASSWHATDKAGCSQCNGGSGVKVCFVEYYRPDNESTLSISDHYVDPPDGYTSWHSRYVAGFVRSTASTGGGAAASSTNYFGNYGGGDGEGGAMYWCAGKGAKVWSLTSSTTAAEDRLYDYWAKHSPYPLIAGSAGNSGSNGVPTSKGYNVLCVGGSDDKGDSTRSNDTIYISTSSKNPDTTHDDRELPVIVAPAVSVTSAGITGTGTSAAAPQVAAAAAQLQSLNSSLGSWPEVQRAILMATADENVDGPVLSLTDTTDDRDGAGAVNIELALSMAGSSYKKNGGNTACQAGHDYGTMNFSSDFTNNYYNEVYKAKFPFSGMRMRVVLAWDSTASCTDSSDPSSCTSDNLDGDLDLYVSTGGRWVATSASWDNSYEFVEFNVQANVEYEIRVYKSSSTASSTYFGLAWNTWYYGS